VTSQGTREIAIVGGGICGLALAMNLHSRGIACRVYERAPEIRELGVGITLLPHAMREFSALGLGDALLDAGIENFESCFYNRFGQLIYREPRGKHAGYPYPEVGIHRGKLHRLLFAAARQRVGAKHILLDRELTGFEQDDYGVTLHFKDAPSARASAAIACDGINSSVRRQLYPADEVVFAGINTWRGVTRRKPILSGRTYIRIGSILTGKLVIYPIVNDVDDRGNQLINWMAEIKQETFEKNDWNQPGELADFFPIYQDWRFGWLDVAELIRSADQVLEYPMVDKNPLARWTFGRVTLAGDAAHPMYPRGSNGAAQAAIDARALSDELAKHADPAQAFLAYESARRDVTAKIVRTNREHPPDFINIKVEELVGDRPFANLDDYISQDELRALSENYKKIAGFSVSDLGQQ
jgi:2-polyprenyl-6-methoxyphenol hydroxylase-like FAD-dependent oxidoreductase